MENDPNVSFVRLLEVARAELGSQLGQEAQLLQAEVKAKTSTILSASLLGIVGGIILLLSMAVALAALVLFIISLGITPALAALIVSVALGIGALTCLLAARTRMKNWTPVPLRTVQALREDFAALKKAVAHVSS
ncbi:hypothetical protein GCM10007874_35750 [Labrys miyagiensis]|uniref:Phage holin family protein n=1 Tax=Labrys miyagiensis TaxID=346912 RepID=A0ABQ6CLD0_9HYPH|nr:phage holin family protein [Labrys miyagiensis]GLS20558.1 hypothetical protein GCM10007874_35750 [Labrys miyagiensis]